MSDEKAKTLTKIFTQVLDETKSYQYKPRFALFSSPPAGALGEGIDQFRARPKRTADGKVITKPRQIYGGRPSSGTLSSSYFSKPIYISIGAPYIDPDRIERQYQMKRKKNIPHEQKYFVPASGEKSDPTKTDFKYEPQDPKSKTVVHKTADGKVPIGPRNFVIGRPKTGHYASTTGHLFSRVPKFMADPYSLKRDKEIKEWKENKTKFQPTPFLTTAHGGRTFSSDKEIFDIKPNIQKKRMVRSRSNSEEKPREPFYPSRPPRKGFNATIGEFPKYMECPPKEIKRKKVEEGAPRKDAFRPNSAFLSRPTPSISLNKLNLKNEAVSLMSARL